jgi:hypothetical protein
MKLRSTAQLASLASTLLFSIPAISQVKQAEFENGVKISYEVLENSTENAKHLMIRAGIGSIGIGAQYMLSDKMLIEGNMSMYSGANAGVIWGLKTNETTKPHSLAVKETSGSRSTTTYLVKGENIIFTDLIGIHGGLRYFSKELYLKSPVRYVTDVMLERVIFPYTGAALVAGPAWYRTGHMKYVVKEKDMSVFETRKFTNRIGVIADIMYSPNMTYLLYHPLHDAIEQYDEYHKLGFLITIDRSTTSGAQEGGSGWGYCWQLSAGYGPAGFLWMAGYGLTF